jgi:hypothetical protein
MKKFENVNAVSPALLDSTKLKRDESKIFVLANISEHPWTKELIIPSGLSIPSFDQIFDDEKNDWVEIAAINRLDKQGNHTYHEITFFGQSAGRIILTGGRGADQEIYSFLKLSNYNGSNPHRDVSKPIYYYEVDETKKAEVEEKRRDLKREALNAASDLSAQDVRDFVASIGIDDRQDLKILRNKLGEMADKNPQDFLDLLQNKIAVIKASVNRAIRDGQIIFDTAASKFSWTHGEEILRVPRAEDAVDELAGYLATNPKGEKILQTLRSKKK